MNAPINLHSVLASLREENDILRETVRQLREELAPVRAFPKAWRLTPQQETVLSCIIAASPGVATYSRIITALYGHEEPPDWVDKMLHVMVSEIRKNLREAGTEPGIRNIAGRGYVMTDARRDHLLSIPESAETNEPVWWAKARRLRAEGLSYRKIAAACGKHKETVRHLLKEVRRADNLERRRRARRYVAEANRKEAA